MIFHWYQQLPGGLYGWTAADERAQRQWQRGGVYHARAAEFARPPARVPGGARARSPYQNHAGGGYSRRSAHRLRHHNSNYRQGERQGGWVCLSGSAIGERSRKRPEYLQRQRQSSDGDGYGPGNVAVDPEGRHCGDHRAEALYHGLCRFADGRQPLPPQASFARRRLVEEQLCTYPQLCGYWFCVNRQEQCGFVPAGEERSYERGEVKVGRSKLGAVGEPNNFEPTISKQNNFFRQDTLNAQGSPCFVFQPLRHTDDSGFSRSRPRA